MDTNTESKSTAKYWMMFLVSTLIMIGFLVILPEWFWVVLPFSLTSLVMAFDAM